MIIRGEMRTILLISGFKLKVFSTIDSQGVLRLPDKKILVRCKIFRVNISNHQNEKQFFSSIIFISV